MSNELQTERGILDTAAPGSLRVLPENIPAGIGPGSEEWNETPDPIKDFRVAAEFATALQREGDFELAHDAFRKALVEVFSGISEVYLSKGDKESAENVIVEAEKIDSGSRKNFEVLEQAFVDQGKIRLQKKHFIGAKAEFQAALTLNENNVSALFGLGEALYGLNEEDEAKTVFERILNSKMAVQDTQIYKEMGMIACRAGYFEIAHRALDRAVKIFPSDSRVFYCKAVVFVAQNDLKGSVPYLNKALRLDPGFTEARTLEHKVNVWMERKNHAGQRVDNREIT